MHDRKSSKDKNLPIFYLIYSFTFLGTGYPVTQFVIYEYITKKRSKK